jgi:hypothetical protein
MSKFNLTYNKHEGFLTISHGTFRCAECKRDHPAFCKERLTKIYARIVPMLPIDKFIKVSDGPVAKPEPCSPCPICDSNKVFLRLRDHMREDHVAFSKLDDPEDELYCPGESSRLRAEGRKKLCGLLSGQPCPGKAIPVLVPAPEPATSELEEEEEEQTEPGTDSSEDSSSSDEEDPKEADLKEWRAPMKMPAPAKKRRIGSEEVKPMVADADWDKMEARLDALMGRDS